MESGSEDWALGMSRAEGPRKFEMEKAAIDEAYRDHIKKLFEVFYSSVAAGKDKEAYLAKFKGNLEVLRRAHIQALSIFSDRNQM